MKINYGVGNFVISKKGSENQLENTNPGSLNRTNEGNTKISEPSLSTVGGNNSDDDGSSSKLDKMVQLEPEVRMDLVNKFKESIKSGEHKTDSEKIASKMISEYLLEDIS
tara:strand:- start:179 stop:508 length:330 start_codon:yes stop_codon:yes gene_type:complete